MHFERLLSSLDRPKQRPDFQVEIAINESTLARAAERDPAKAPRVALRADQLWRAVNDFS